MFLPLLLFVANAKVALSIECYKCAESPLIPSSNSKCNATCTGDFCYRAEKSISSYTRVASKESAVLMDCFDYPFPQLKLGCRRNQEGVVLCVCKTDFCNAEKSGDTDTLPIVDCLSGDVPSSFSDKLQQCRSHYCINNRWATMRTSSASTHKNTFECQQDGALLTTFDIFVDASPFTMPAGMCLKVQYTVQQIIEFCSCPYSRNCSTSTKYPGDSGLPLDNRNKEFISCAIPTRKDGVEECLGHVCFIAHGPRTADRFGCITYDELDNRRLPLGAIRMLDFSLFLCDKKSCNMRSDIGTVFAGLKTSNPVNESCNCLSSSVSRESVPENSNIPMILGISIPVLIIAIISIALISFRIKAKKWPCQFTGKVLSNRAIKVTSIDPLKNK